MTSEVRGQCILPDQQADQVQLILSLSGFGEGGSPLYGGEDGGNLPKKGIRGLKNCLSH